MHLVKIEERNIEGAFNLVLILEEFLGENKMHVNGAASKGYIECLKYAHENKCCLSKKVCSNAAENGHLNCLIYACNRETTVHVE